MRSSRRRRAPSTQSARATRGRAAAERCVACPARGAHRRERAQAEQRKVQFRPPREQRDDPGGHRQAVDHDRCAARPAAKRPHAARKAEHQQQQRGDEQPAPQRLEGQPEQPHRRPHELRARGVGGVHKRGHREERAAGDQQQAEPVAHPSVTLTLTVTPDMINVGDEATWTAMLTNDGDDDLHQVTVRRDETLLGDIADFAVGQEQRFTFTTRPPLTGQTIKAPAAGLGSTGKMVRAESSTTVQVSTPERLTITSPVHLDLVYVPAGEFLMGTDPTTDPESSWSSLSDEQPQHRVYVSDFYIGKYPITNAQYAVFVKAAQGGAPTHWKNGLPPVGKENHPVVNVSWFDAVAFCKWLSQKTGNCFRLPTEAEWEKAARGTDGRIWPWGNNWDKSRLNNSQYRTPVIALSLVEAVVDMARLRGTTPVDQYSPRGDSPYGTADMVGNVYEWCAAWYDDKEHQRRATSVVKDPQGPESGEHRIVRGGDYEVFPQHCRAAARNRFAPDTRYSGCGFRVVFDPA